MNQPHADDAGALDRTLSAPSGPPTAPRTAPAPTRAMPRTEGFAPRPSDPKDETVEAAGVTVTAVDLGDPPLGPTVTADGGPPGSAPTVFFDPGKPTPSGGRGPADRPTVEGYDILGELGRGGMGVVYKARQTGLDRLVALKMVLAGAHADADQLERFYLEAQAVAHLKHPNIVQIYEVGARDGLPYFSLEYVEGGPLSARLGGKPLPAREAAWLVLALARAMEVAHAQGIIHRDLKPANILLDTDGTPKITDFGLAKRLEGDSKQTRSGAIMGTPSYMAPEQALGLTHEIGPLADQYALGAILYELLTGRPPFQGATVLDTLEMVRSQEPVPPSRLQPKLPIDLETICLKCLQKPSHRRYADAGALAEDLGRFLDGRTILARPVKAPERLWRWGRRNPKVAGLSAAVFLLLGAVTAISTASAVQLRIERDATRAQKEIALKNEHLAVAARKLADERATAEKAARLEAEAAVTEADKNNKLSIEAQRVLIGYVNAELKNSPGNQVIRQKILQAARQGLERSLDGMASLNPVARKQNTDVADRALAGTYKQVGDLMLEVGEIGAADESFRRMDGILEQMARADPRGAAVRNSLAKSKAILTYLHLVKLGNAEAAEVYARQALELRRELLADRPDDDGAKLAVANSLGQLANVRLRTGDPAGARRYYDEELAVRGALPPAKAGKFEARRELSGLHEKLSDVCLQLGEIDAGRDHLDRCARLREALAREDPSHLQARRDVARTRCSFGHLHLLYRRDPGVALDGYRKALGDFQAIAAEDPLNAVAREDVAMTHYYVGTALLRLGEAKEADDHYHKCLEIRQDLPTDPKAKLPETSLMVALARCGNHEEAAAIADRLIASPPRDAQVYFQAACGYALAADAARRGEPTETGADRARRYKDSALAALRKGLAAGWKGAVVLETDPDLDPIRDDPDFRHLLDELKARAPVAKRS